MSRQRWFSLGFCMLALALPPTARAWGAMRRPRSSGSSSGALAFVLRFLNKALS